MTKESIPQKTQNSMEQDSSRRDWLVAAKGVGALLLLNTLNSCKAHSQNGSGLEEATRSASGGTGLCRPQRPIDSDRVAAKVQKPQGSKGKIGVLIGQYFDPYEYRDFNIVFPEAGFDVEYITDLRGKTDVVYFSNPEHDGAGGPGPLTGNETRADGSKRDWHHRYWVKEVIKVTRCVRPGAGKKYANPNNYDAIIMIGAMAMNELRYVDKVVQNGDNESPAVKYIRNVLTDNNSKNAGTPKTIVAAICHSLWLLTGTDLLKGRNVTCGHNLIGDVGNAGGIIQYENGITENDPKPSGELQYTSGDSTKPIVVDNRNGEVNDLLTARHPEIRLLFIHNIIELIKHRASHQTSPFRIRTYQGGKFV